MPASTALRARAIVAHAAAAAAVLIVASAGRSILGLGPWYMAKAFVPFVLMSMVCIALVARTHLFARYGAANHVTLVRSTLVALLGGLIGESATSAVSASAASVSLVATALDGMDGWLARRSGMSSAYGARFDMETDSALVLVISILAWRHGKAGVWVVACGLMRYAFVAGGMLMPWLAGPLQPTLRGKTVAAIQMAALSIVLLPMVDLRVGTAIAALALATLTWSFAIDIARLWRNKGGHEEFQPRRSRRSPM